MKQLSIALLLFVFFSCVSRHKNTSQQSAVAETKILTGADQTDKYLPLLKGKRVGILSHNHYWQNAFSGQFKIAWH
jgi:uncharacterized protein YbbC (DUF1343 family)